MVAPHIVATFPHLHTAYARRKIITTRTLSIQGISASVQSGILTL